MMHGSVKKAVVAPVGVMLHLITVKRFAKAHAVKASTNSEIKVACCACPASPNG